MDARTRAMTMPLGRTEIAYISHRELQHYWQEAGYFKAALWNKLMVTELAIALNLMEHERANAKNRQLHLEDAEG
jgi:hypothetical protein